METFLFQLTSWIQEGLLHLGVAFFSKRGSKAGLSEEVRVFELRSEWQEALSSHVKGEGICRQRDQQGHR